MAERLAYLEAVVGADITQFRKGMRDIRNEAGVFSETMRGIAGAARTLTFAFTVPMVALGSLAVQTASKFDASMRNINAIAGLSEQQFRDLSDATIEFGKNTRGGAIGAAEALYTVFSAGITDVAIAFDIMEVSTHTAEAGLADVVITTEALIATMLSYQDTSREFAEETSDAMTHMVAVGVGSMQDFATGIGKVIPAAGALGMSLEQLYGDMAFLTQRGMSAAVSSTALRQALISMAKPSEAMSSAFRELGADSAEGLIAQFGGVNEAITALVGTTDGSLTEINALWTNIRGAMAIQQFANDVDGWNAQMDEFGANMAGATDRAWIQQMSSFSAAVDLMTSALSAAAIVLGRELMPFIRPVMEGIRGLALSITDINPEVIRIVAGLGLVAAALPPLIWFMASLASPVGVLSVALIALAGIISTELIAAFGTFLTGSQPFKDDLQELSEIIERVTGWDFMPDTSVDEIMGAEPVVLDLFRNITILEPMSLWDVYEAEGYADTFSWDAFMTEMLTNGGWEGGAILPGMNLKWPSGGITTDAAENQLDEAMLGFKFKPFEMDMPLVKLTGIQEILPPKTLMESIEMWSPMLISRFNTVWNNVVVWLDGKASTFALSIASWFDTATMQPLYTALTLAMTGDFAGAIDAIIPGLTVTVGSLFSRLFGLDQELTIVEALRTLGKSAANFFLTDFVPAVAQGIGFATGRIAVMLYEGITAAIQFVFGGGAANAAGDVAGYVDEGVIQPFAQGFEQAIAGTNFAGLTTGLEVQIQEMFTTISDLSSFLSIDEMWGAATSFLDSIGNALTTLGNADWSGVAKLLGLVTVLGGTAMSAFINLFNGLAVGFGGIVESVAVALSGVVNLIAGIANNDVEQVMGGLVEFFVGLGFALVQFPLGVVTAIADAILDILNIDLDLSNINETMTQWRDDLVDALTRETTHKPLEWTPQVELQWTSGALEWFGDDMGGAIPALSPTGELVIDMSGFTITPDDEEWIDNFFAELMDNATKSGDTTTLDFFRDYFAGQGFIVPMPNLTFTDDFDPATAWEGEAGGLGLAEMINQRAVTELEGFEQSPEAQAAMNTAMAAFAVTGVATDEEGNLTAQPIIDNYLIPLETAWIERFGEAGTMTAAFSEFTAVAVTGFDLTEEAMISLHDYAKVDFQEFPVFMVDAINPVVAAIENFTDAAEDALKAVKDLLDMKGNASIKISIETSGLEEPETDGNHAGGLGKVPFDGYIAELHKGEEVLTASAAAERRQSMSADVAYGNSSATGNTTVVNNEYNINGVQDVDRFIAEMKRRGYKIDNG